MSDPCEFKDKIGQLGEDMSGLKKDIEHTLEYIRSGSKYRITVICSCIGLVGLFISGWVKFNVNDYRLGIAESDVKEVRKELYDLNYVKGKEIGRTEIDSI